MRAGALPGGEKQVFGAVVCDEVACDQGAERAGASRDEDGAFWVEGTGKGEDELSNMPRLSKGFAFMDEDRDGYLTRDDLKHSPRH